MSYLKRHLGELVVIVMLCGAVYSDLSRFVGPVQERYVAHIVQPGGIDLASPYLATQVYLRGGNPYRHDIAELKDPLGRDREVFNGHRYDFVYGPAHVLLYAPLVWATGGNRHLGHRVWFHLNLVWCVLLAVVIGAIAAQLRPAPIGLGTSALLAAALALCPAQNMLLERGQSDLVIALLCWAAVLAALRGAWGFAVGLALVSVLMKPYAVPLLGGLIVFAVAERARRPLLIGLATASAGLLPVWHLVPVSLQASFDRSQHFVDHWTSSSFRRLLHSLGVPHPELVKWVLLALGVLACLAMAYRYVHAANDPAPASRAQRSKILVTFACAALAFSLGASDASAFYNLGLVIPGLLALGLTEHPDDASTPARGWLSWMLMFLACATLFWAVPRQAMPFPTPALGFLLVFAFALLQAFREEEPPREGNEAS